MMGLPMFFVWSNLFFGHDDKAISHWWGYSRQDAFFDGVGGNGCTDGSTPPYCYWPPIHTDNIHVYGNTFYRNSPNDNSEDGKTQIVLGEAGGTNFFVKNNILYQGRPNASTYQEIYITDGATSETTIDNNLYYYPGQTSQIYWGSSGLVSAGTVDSNAVTNDPNFDDAENADFTWGSSDPPENAGATLSDTLLPMNDTAITIQGQTYCPSGCDVTVSLSHALDESTDIDNPWTGFVIKTSRTGAWDIGAYEK
jgi:hypothetical protein